MLADLLEIVGRLLVDIVVQPIAIEQVCMPPPANDGIFRGVVFGIVVVGHLNIEPLSNIPIVFPF